MRRLIAATAVVLTSCPGARPPNLPPTNVFYFPTGLHHLRTPTSPVEGVLYVVSSNFDKRYDFGQLTAVDLDQLDLPPFGGNPDGSTPTVVDLKVNPDAGSGQTVLLSSFGSNIAVWPRPGGGERMFVVARSEGRLLMAIDTDPSNPLKMVCVPALLLDGGINPAENAAPGNCGAVGASLTYNELTDTSIPRAPSPMMTAVSTDGGVWVTSAEIVDSPRGSGMNYAAYVVHVLADASLLGGPPNHFLLNNDNFFNVGPVPTDGVTIGQRWTYVTGRYAPLTSATFATSTTPVQSYGSTPVTSTFGNPASGYAAYGFTTPTAQTVLLRLIDPNDLLNVGLEQQVSIPDARGIALSHDETRLYLLGRLTPYVIGSDQLVVASISDPVAASGTTLVNVIRMVPVCDEPQEVRTVVRPGHTDLVVITCAGGAVAAQGGATAAGELVLYDDEVGNLVGQVPNVGLQPDSLTIDVRPTGGMRVFVSNFTDGRVAMIDVTNLAAPQTARIVGYLGAAQTCVTRNFSDTSCDGGVVIPDGGGQ
jgi:hypothetical protein